MHLHDFTALTFDCYGTLIDWESGILAAFGPWRKRMGVAADDNRLLELFAEADDIAALAIGRKPQFQRPAGVAQPDLRRILHPVPAGLFSRRQAAGGDRSRHSGRLRDGVVAAAAR